MNSLIDLAESGAPFPQNCFIVRRGYLEANRSKIVNGMKAIIEGYFAVKNDKTLGLQLIKKYIRVDGEDANIIRAGFMALIGSEKVHQGDSPCAGMTSARRGNDRHDL